MDIPLKRKVKLSSSVRYQNFILDAVVNVVLALLSVACLVPILIIISSSFSDENDLSLHGYSIIPRVFSIAAYDYILRDPSQILRSYGVTTSVTIVGSSLSLLLMASFAYVLARKSFPWRKQASFYLYFTMLFNGGLVPWYIMITKYLQMRNTFWALVIPALLSPWYVFLLRTYFSSLAEEMIEAAKIDGASEWRIFYQIALPLSTPALATVGLFCLLGFWNDWWLGMLFVDNRDWAPLQLLLWRIQNNIAFLESAPLNSFGAVIKVPAMTTRMALAVLAIGPIGLAYFFVQRYLIRGITVGSIKG